VDPRLLEQNSALAAQQKYMETRMEATDANTSKLLQLFSNVAERLSATENQQSSLDGNLDVLNNNQSQLQMTVSSLPTAEQLADLKMQLESQKQTLGSSTALANSAQQEVNKLGLQVFEQQTKLTSLLDMGKSLEQSSMLMDELRLTVDEMKQNQPNVKSMENDVSSFRREFHSRLAEESEFRDTVNKKNQVMFNELVRLGETLEKDRGAGRSEINEMAGIVTAVEKRLKSTEDTVDRSTKAHGSKLIGLDGAVNTLENAITSFGRDVQQIATSLGAEQKVRKNAVENRPNAQDDIRSGVQDLMNSTVANNDRKMATLEEQLRSTMEGVRNESERGRKFIEDQIGGVAKSVSNETASRTASVSDLSVKLVQVEESMKAVVNDVREDVVERLQQSKKEETELAIESLKNQEDIKGHLAIMEKEVYETQSQTNARIDRTRAALEEVLRAEIQVSARAKSATISVSCVRSRDNNLLLLRLPPPPPLVSPKQLRVARGARPGHRVRLHGVAGGRVVRVADGCRRDRGPSEHPGDLPHEPRRGQDHGGRGGRRGQAERAGEDEPDPQR
jgi:hypothetical protein